MQQGIVYRSATSWDQYSGRYARRIAKNTSVFCMTLLNMTQFEDANCILDAGCATGFIHQHIINQKKPDAHLYGFDWSPLMVQRAAARMKRYLTQKEKGSLDNITEQEVEQVSLNDETFSKINYHLSVGDIQDLSQYKDGMFDIYLSNLVLQMVTDQEKSMAEAFRVLKPGGKIGITIWASQENCAALWFLKEIAFKTGLSPVGMKGGRFLTSSEQPINLAKNAGFQNILCWEQMNPFDVVDMKNIEDFFNPEIEGILAQASEEQRKTFYQGIESFIQEHRIKSLPLPFDCYLLIAEKPL